MSDAVKVLEELKDSIAKQEGKIRNVNHGSVWGGQINQRHLNQTCPACNQRKNQIFVTYQKMRHQWICRSCSDYNIDQIYTQRSTGGNCHICNMNCGSEGYLWPATNWQICVKCAGKANGISGVQMIAKIDAQLKSEKKKVTDMAKKEKTIEEAAIPYINSGLAEPFAIAIARDVSLIEQILDLWEQDWWKQYPPEDILVCAVLDGELSEDDGRWLNEIRSDHERLALACVTKEIDLDWARALLGAGYLDHPEAVPDVLDGGHPVAIARIRGIKVDAKLLPPQLGFKLSKSSIQKKTNGQSIANVTHKEIKKVLLQLDDDDISKITSGYLKTSQDKDWKIGWISLAWNRINSRRFSSTERKVTLRNLADDIQLQGRTNMNADQLRKTMIKLRSSLRDRISSIMDAKGITF